MESKLACLLVLSLTIVLWGASTKGNYPHRNQVNEDSDAALRHKRDLPEPYALSCQLISKGRNAYKINVTLFYNNSSDITESYTTKVQLRNYTDESGAKFSQEFEGPITSVILGDNYWIQPARKYILISWNLNKYGHQSKQRNCTLHTDPPTTSLSFDAKLDSKVFTPSQRGKKFNLYIYNLDRFGYNVNLTCKPVNHGFTISPSPVCNLRFYQAFNHIYQYEVTYNLHGVNYLIEATPWMAGDDSPVVTAAVNFTTDLNSVVGLEKSVESNEVIFKWKTEPDTPFPHHVHILCFTCAVLNKEVKKSENSQHVLENYAASKLVRKETPQTRAYTVDFKESDKEYKFFIWVSVVVGKEGTARSPFANISVFSERPTRRSAESDLITVALVFLGLIIAAFVACVVYRPLKHRCVRIHVKPTVITGQIRYIPVRPHRNQKNLPTHPRDSRGTKILHGEDNLYSKLQLR